MRISDWSSDVCSSDLVAHPAITYTLIADDKFPILVCDRRQIAPALTNLVKNATEPVEARREVDNRAGQVEITVTAEAEQHVSAVLEAGIGPQRDTDPNRHEEGTRCARLVVLGA